MTGRFENRQPTMAARQTALPRWALVIALFAAMPTHGAQAAAVSVDGFYNQTVSKSCPTTDVCQTPFSAVPAGKTLIVTNVSCTIQAGGTALLTDFYMVLKEDDTFDYKTYLLPVYLGASGGNRQLRSNNPAVHIAKARQKLTVLTRYDGAITSTLTCSIAGELK